MSDAISAAETSAQVAALPERTHSALLKIIRDNVHTQYASQAPSLAGFRDAVSAHGGTEVDATLLADFKTHVPLSNYDTYKPFVDKFDAEPCKEADVIDMFSPGLPDFLAVSSATSGSKPKILAKYNHAGSTETSALSRLDSNNKDSLALVVCTAYRDVRVVQRASGEVVRRIPVCSASGGGMRRYLGWYIDDESSMSLACFAVPRAATVIGHVPSFLVIHGLFFLVQRNVNKFCVAFGTQFVDLVRCIDEHWGVLVSCIRDGTLPDVQGIDHVRRYLQAHLRPNPERAAELVAIGPPFSSQAWFSRVWPKVETLFTICSGPFATVLPKVRSILGPNVIVRCPGYASTEGAWGVPHENKLDEFVLKSDDIVEFLDVTLDETHKHLCRAWEVEVGKRYEPIVTTRCGLWRYRLGDVLHILGFHPESKQPLFNIAGRRALTMRFPFAEVTDDQLLAAIQGLSRDAACVHEFTTVLDDRASLPTVGFFIELAGPLGAHAQPAVPQTLFDALVVHNSELQHAFELGKMRLPTVRVVKTGTFGEYRRWKGERVHIVSGQIKAPVVMLDPSAQAWLLERVVQEV